MLCSQTKQHFAFTAEHLPPLLLLPLSLLILLLFTATGLSLLLLLQRQVLVRLIINKIVHVASFLTLGEKNKRKSVNHNALSAV